MLGVVAILVGAGYFWQKSHTLETAPPQATHPVDEKAAPRYPVPEITADTGEPSQPSSADKSAPLRASSETSDDALVEQLRKLTDQTGLETLLHLENLVKRFVVMVDSATGSKFPNNLSVFEPVDDEFAVDQSADGMVLAEANFARYTPYLNLMRALDSKKLVALYSRHYALFQSAYRDIGRDGYFNDRLVDVIESALAAPELKGPIKLTSVGLYRFADPDLEALPVVQKVLIRMGTANEGQVKQKLRSLRSALTHEHP